MRSKNDLLKKLALQAKKRLIGEIQFNTYYVDEGYKSNVKTLSCEEHEKFYKKVCKLLSENKDIRNPIGKLIDYEVYNSLPSLSKEKYFFDLVDKYGECKERFEKEHEFVI
ncbi:MAG: hypothetical protein PHX09_02150 [Clostridia bacterium]|nr:hypothetical protein [Clostridia bacterium]MDD4686343.1 hypothetical protein [Clostridia bacterium]